MTYSKESNSRVHSSLPSYAALPMGRTVKPFSLLLAETQAEWSAWPCPKSLGSA